jgi:hypothetical protein
MYEIILYNKGKRVRKIAKYVKYGNAIRKYDTMLKTNNVFFPKEKLWDGRKTDYELVLTAPAQNSGKKFIRNEFGAMVKVKPKGNFVIKKINKYAIEDVFKDRITGKKYTFKTFIKELLKNQGLTYVLLVISNKIVIERFENEDLNVLILKNQDASYLLSETIKTFNLTNNVNNFIYFQDPSLDTKLRIYDRLEEEFNISRDYMQKVSTH